MTDREYQDILDELNCIYKDAMFRFVGGRTTQSEVDEKKAQLDEHIANKDILITVYTEP